VLSRNLALAVKNSETTADDYEKATDMTQSQDVTADVHCLRQVTTTDVYIQGGPIKAVHFLRYMYRIFAATADLIMQFSFSAVISEHFSKNGMIISVVAAKIVI